jgi:signal transduction histidine kinase
MVQRSLRLKYALVVNVVILAPLAFYLLWDIHLERQTILESRIEVLHSMGRLLVEQLTVDPGAEMATTQTILDQFHQHQQSLEIYVLDGESRVVASTIHERLGRTWTESEFRSVLDGSLDLAWELDAHDGLPVLEITIPAPGIGIIHIAEPQATLERKTREGRIRSVAFVTLLLVILSGTVTLVTDRMVIRRIRWLTSDLGRTPWLPADRVPSADQDELAILGDALGRMLAEIERTTGELQQALRAKQDLLERVEGFNEELEAQVEATRRELQEIQEELLRKERLSTIGELAAGLAHEIRNPLQIIQATAETVRRRHPEAGTELQYVIEEVSRLNRLVHDLLDYARPCAVNWETVAVDPLVDRAIREAGLVLADVAIEKDVQVGCSCDGDVDLLAAVLVNLLTNAAESLDGEGHVTVRGIELADDGCLLEVHDTGIGIAPDDLGQVFAPFFSRKEAGVGMGLCLSRRIVEQHGGTMDLSSDVGRGTKVVVRLPSRGEKT